MNTVIKILFFTLIILLFSCKKEPKYYDIPENIRQALLYYYNPDSDTIMFLKNNVDTLLFVYKTKNILYNKPCPSCDYFEYYESQMNSINSNYFISIEAMVVSSLENSYWIGIANSNPEFSLSANNIFSYNNDYYQFGQHYSNVYCLNYKINGVVKNDSIYTSIEKGILKMKNDSIIFTLIE